MKDCLRSNHHRQHQKRKANRVVRRLRKISKRMRRGRVSHVIARQPMIHEVKQVKDLKLALKDMELFVKDPRFLRVGRDLSNFKLRPREVWANWLLCAVANFEDGSENMTFTTDPTGGDGIIRNKKTGKIMLTEHVIALSNKEPKSDTEDQLAEAIEHKIKRGDAYAKGKHLVVFSDVVGMWTPNRLAARISASHSFISVWVIALQEVKELEYTYNLTELDVSSGNAPIWNVKIGAAFDSWAVTRTQ